jgi:hypothetical protein
VLLYNSVVKERPLFQEISPELLQAYAMTFLNRLDCYPLQREIGTYFTLRKPLTLNIFRAHLQGAVTIGAYALNAESIAKWLCLDADEDAQWQQLRDVAGQLAHENIPVYLETSRRGGHLWLFTTPLSGRSVRQFGKGLLYRYGVGKVELYPKQNVLKTGVGSFVRLPFGIHRKTGRRYYFVTPDGEPLAPTVRQQIAVLAQPQLVPQDFITKISAEVPPFKPKPVPLPHPRATNVSGEYLSQRLKNAVRVYEFVSRYVLLDAQGKGLCPFHDDEIHSFQVNIEENYWSCYAGCGGGSLIDFWMKWRETNGQDGSFTATVTELAQLLL